VHNYFFAYKPFQVLSRFSTADGRQTLKDFFTVPGDVYPVGRLDYDSEGLLILSNDALLNNQLLHPDFAHEREYRVQVEGIAGPEAIARLESGPRISIEGKPYKTRPCKAGILLPAPQVPERNPPIRFRKNIPTSWISLVLTEGKNRQVRKMTAAVGLPTLRLIRHRIGAITLDRLQPGEMIRMKQEEVYMRLGLIPGGNKK